jgi:hypothetical protein
MPNIKLTNDNLWCSYYEDDTEPKGFYIDEVYSGSDPARVNIADYISDSFLEFIESKIEYDISINKAWRG